MQEIKDIMEQMKKGFGGKITDVTKMGSQEFYTNAEGKKNNTYEDREGYAITVVLDNFDTEIREFLAIPSPLGWAKSKMGKFVDRYGTYPQIDMVVECKPDDESGLMKLKL